MPYRRQYSNRSTTYVRRGRKKKFQGRRYGKRNYGSYRNYRSGPTKALVPNTKKITMKFSYCDNINTFAYGVTNGKVFRGNSVYDPDYATGGHQPYGMEQMVSLYNSYTVIATSAILTISNEDAHTTIRAHLGVLNKNTASLMQSNTYQETPRVKTALVNGNQVKTMKIRFNPNKLLGITKPLTSEEVTQSISSNPNEVPYIHAAFSNADQALNDTKPITYKIDIYYTVIFSDPKNIGPSTSVSLS